MICVYPDFYRAFACKATFCRHSCCRGWEIDVDEESAAYYRALPGKLGDDLRAALVEEAGVWHFRLTDEERCPFLRPDGLCRLIRELGEQALCDICALHPRFYGELGSFEFCGLGLSCEKVCELLLESSAPLRFRLDDEAELLDFAGLLRRMGLEPAAELLRFTPKPGEARYAEILRRLSETEPIDENWTEEIRQLRAVLPDLVENAVDYAAVCDRGRYDRIYQYILFRQLERAGEYEFPVLAVYARLSTEFVFMQDALLGADPEHLRRWSEQIEYSTENVDRLLSI
ncbi:MAG: flagellin lysine-N-methylase [Oscillospiraceae bacterium]|nr:flagellin lysine-N-methylase [Oscillospiraceae bacterium]